MALATRRRISLGIAVFSVFLPVRAWCAQQDSNLQPLAPEAMSVRNSGGNSQESDTSKNVSKTSVGLLIPAVVFGALQAADLGSTYYGIDTGRAREANGVMAPILQNKPAAIALKAGVTVGTIYLASRVGRKHPTAAKVLLWSLNGVMAGVVAHNVQVIRR